MSVVVSITLNGTKVPVELDDDALSAIATAITPQPEPPSPYMSIVEAANYLRCSRQRVDDLLSARRLERVKDGARVLIRRHDLEAYLAACSKR